MISNDELFREIVLRSLGLLKDEPESKTEDKNYPIINKIVFII